MPTPVATKSAPKTTTTNKVKTMPKADKVSHTMDSIEYRKQCRDEIFECKDTRKFHPLSLDIVRKVVLPDYLPIFDKAVKSGKEVTVRIDLSDARDFIHAWMKANGANRTPKDVHYNHLAVNFANEFSSSATHWVLTVDGMVSNAGHSGMATAIAYYPEDIFYGISGLPHEVPSASDPKTMVTVPVDSAEGKALLEAEDNNGYYFAAIDDKTGENLVHYSIVPPRPEGLRPIGQYEGEKFIEGSDSPELRDPEKMQATLVINAPANSCLKMDDVRLEASYQDFLEMVGPLRSYIKTLPISIEQLATVLLNWYKRTNHKVASESITFGSLGKGGRPTKSDVQQWAITAIPLLKLSLQYLLNTEGKIRLFPLWTKNQFQKGGITLVYALVSMMVSDDKGRKRIAELLTMNIPANDTDLKDDVREFRDKVLVPANATSHALNADSLVECLILYGLGKPNWVELGTTQVQLEGHTADKPALANSWQVEALRAKGWDRNELDLGEEKWQTTLIEAAKRLSALLGDTTSSDNAERKATRKGEGKRGPNRKK